MTMGQLICDVCSMNPAVGVGSVPMVPISMAYCRDCLDANAHPYPILVANTAIIGGLEHARSEWVDMVDATLSHLSITREKFAADVDQTLATLPEGYR